MIKETAKTSDYTLVKYKDPETGKIKFRKMRHNDRIVKQQDVEEKAVSKAQQKFFGMVRAKQKGEMPNASPEVKKAAASMSKKDVKDFAATKHKGLPAKKESTDAYGKSMDAIANKKKKAAISKPDLDKLSKLKDLMKKANEATMSDKAGPGKGKDMRDMSKLDHAKARDYHQYRVKSKGDYHSKMAKIHHANAIGGSSMLHKEGYIGAKGEKGRDYHNAGTFDKDTAYSHAKKHNGVVHKDPSGKYLVKHGKGKHVGEENIKELSPDTVKRYRDKASDDQPRQKRIAHDYATRTGDNKSDWTDKMAKVHQRAADNRAKGIARANKKLGEAKTFEDFKSDLAKRKAANLAKRGARRGPAKGTAKKDGDWDQKAAKPLGFEIKNNDHHSTVHNTLAKAADAMHPSLGGRKVSLKLGGKTKVYSNHKDLQHVIDYHQKLKDKGQKAQLMRNVRDNGHDHISKVTNVYRKATGQ